MPLNCFKLYQTHNEYYLPHLAVFQSPFAFFLLFLDFSVIYYVTSVMVPRRMAIQPVDRNGLLTHFMGPYLESQDYLLVHIFFFLNLEKWHLDENNS